MRQDILRDIQDSIQTKQALLDSDIPELIERAARKVFDCLQKKGKLLFFGNGGSASDSQHLAAEFVGRYEKERRGLAAIALTTDTSILTAVGNDYGFDRVFARQIEALGNHDDIAFGITPSGNSKNVLLGLERSEEHT